TNIFGTAVPQQLTLQNYGKTKSESLTKLSKQLDKERVSLFTNSRSQIVQKLADQYRFFHYQLEFIEVFKERDGFDAIVGNPPWLKVTFEEKDIMAEVYPELIFKNISANKVKDLRISYLSNSIQQKAYFEQNIGIESAAAFMGSNQNYSLLIGQQANL